MKETVKPLFIYFAVGDDRKGRQEAVFEKGAVEITKPASDPYCSVHLTHSAYEKVITVSMASQPAAAANADKTAEAVAAVAAVAATPPVSTK